MQNLQEIPDLLPNGGVLWYDVSHLACIPSTTYIISSWLKWLTSYPDTNFWYLRQYRNNGSQISEHGLFNIKALSSKEWHKVSTTFTLHGECTSFKIQGYQYITPCEIWCSDLQLELKPCKKMRFMFNFADGYTGDLHLYMIDWENHTRRQTVTVVNHNGPFDGPSNGLLLPSYNTYIENITSSFSDGVWLHVPVTAAPGGFTVITIEHVSGPNGVISGIFLDPNSYTQTDKNK